MTLQMPYEPLPAPFNIRPRLADSLIWWIHVECRIMWPPTVKKAKTQAIQCLETLPEI